MSAATCMLFLLGQPRLLRPGAAPHLLERRDAALLAALVLQGPLPRERAIAWLWPQADRKAGQNNLRQRLFRLKQLAGQEVVSSAAVLHLAEGVLHDIGSLPQRLLDGTAEDDQLLATLDYADTGDLADWVDQARQRWHTQRQTLLAQAADTHQQQGRLDAALRCTERLLQHDPAAESAHRQRMRLHYLRGDRVAALAAWAHCVQMLRREADAEPDAQTCELAALIERSGALPDTRSAAAVASPPPAVLLRPPQLIGRADAWSALQAAWQGSRAVVVLGEPGIGKSRLLADFAQAQPGALLLGARPGDAGLPYTLLQRVLRALSAQVGDLAPWVRQEFARLLPELGEAAAGRLEPLRLQRAVGQALADAHAQHGLRVLMLDDFQFADTATQELLLACLSQPAVGLPAPWLAVRAGEVPQPLRDWWDEQPPGAVAELALSTLNPAQVNDFVASLGLARASAAEWAPTLVRRTGGNPLFMLQVLQAAHDSGPTSPAGAAEATPPATIPASVGRLIERRLGQLGAPALRLARVAALAGPDFTLTLAAEVLAVHAVDLADGLTELQRAQLMVDAGFAYDLVAEAVLRTVPDALAQLLHAGIAQALARRGAAPARVAEHHRLAQEWAAAATQFERAARQADRPADELAWEDQASLCHQRAGAAQAALDCRVRAATAAIVVEPAVQAVQRIDALLADATDARQRLHALLVQGQQQLAGGQQAGALAAQQALQLARQLGDSQLELRAVTLQCAALVLMGRGHEALPLFEQMLPLAGTLGNVKDEQEFFSYYGYVLSGASRYREALAPLRRACALAEQAGELYQAMTEAGNLSAVLHRLGERDATLEAAERAIGFWRRQGEPGGVMGGALHMRAGVYYFGVGRYAEALSAFDLALAMFRAGRVGEWATHTEHHLARFWLALGQTARAQQVLTPLPDDASASSRNKRLMVQARIARQSGRWPPDLLRNGLVFTTDIYGSDRFDAQLLLAATLPPDEALALCDDVLAASPGPPSPASQHALVRRADCLRRLGRHEEALVAVRQALAGQQVSALELTPPEFACLACQALEAAGAGHEAQAVLRDAVAWLTAAQRHVPAEFVESFRQRNPDHRALLLRAAELVPDSG